MRRSLRATGPIGGHAGYASGPLLAAAIVVPRGQTSLAWVSNRRRVALAGPSSLAESEYPSITSSCCPHSAIREDISSNLLALEELHAKFRPQMLFIESGGDNLAATFSPELADLTIYVIDVAGGEKIPRKGGPGITKSDLFVINKTDLAPYVGANLDVMKADTLRMRGARPFVMSNLKTLTGLTEVVAFIEAKGMLKA